MAGTVPVGTLAGASPRPTFGTVPVGEGFGGSKPPPYCHERNIYDNNDKRYAVYGKHQLCVVCLLSRCY